MGLKLRRSRRNAVGVSAVVVTAFMAASFVFGGTAAYADEGIPSDSAVVDETIADASGETAEAVVVAPPAEPVEPASEPVVEPPSSAAEPVVEPPSSAAEPVAEPVGGEQAPAPKVDAPVAPVEEQVWVPASTLVITQVPCGEEDSKSNVNLTYTQAPGESIVGSWVEGQPTETGGDNSLYLTPGVYKYFLKVRNISTQEEVSVEAGTITIVSCEVPPDCQDSLVGLVGSVSHTNTEVTYVASIPKEACADLTVYGDTYTLPASYDGSGSFNGSSSPQHYVPSARAVMVIAKGQTSVTITKSFVSALQCGVSNWLQADVYTGPQQDVVTHPQGSNGYIAGYIFKVVQGDCVTTGPEGVPQGLDECGVDNDTLFIPAASNHARFEVIDNRVDGVGTVLVKLVPDNGYKLAEGVQTDWTLVFTNKPCPVKPTPPTPSEPTPSTPAVVVPPAPTSAPKAQTKTSEKLAVTGGESPFGFLAFAAFSVIAGGAMMAIRRRSA